MRGASTGISVAFVTMGCAKNEVDSARMADLLRDAGYEVHDDVERADAVIVNTCSFIQAATEESIEAVLDIANLASVEEGRAKLVVSGCMPARYGSELEDELNEASAFVPCAGEDGIVEVIDGLFGIERVVDNGAKKSIAASKTGDVSSYVKISDGCDRFCAYCTIPYIRGRYRSFSYDDIAANVASLVSQGIREIILIAQDTGRWGMDLDEPSSLARLMGSLADSHPDTWFRVMYVQPEGITDELVEVVATHDNICNYFDIPLQHCNPAILKSMNRKGNGDQFMALLERIRTRIPDCTLRTTLIAGFPGETDGQFEELCSFVEEAPLDYIGVFAYSREEGTRAYDLPGQVDDDEKAYRAQTIRDLADAVCTVRIAQRVGSEVNVLVCGVEEDGQLYGRAMSQAPDVDGVTYIDCGTPGEIVRVTIDETLMYEMEGTCLH